MDKSSIHYETITLANGQVALQCRACESCPKRETNYFKRLDIMNHLKVAHNIVIQIPLRKVGRPKGMVGHNASSSMFHKQTHDRFFNVAHKFENNRKKYHKLQTMKAEIAWATLEDSHGLGSKEEFMEEFVAKAMEAYMASKEQRLHAIQKRVDEGYEKYVSASLIVNVSFYKYFNTHILAYHAIYFEKMHVLKFRNVKSKVFLRRRMMTHSQRMMEMIKIFLIHRCTWI